MGNPGDNFSILWPRGPLVTLSLRLALMAAMFALIGIVITPV